MGDRLGLGDGEGNGVNDGSGVRVGFFVGVDVGSWVGVGDTSAEQPVNVMKVTEKNRENKNVFAISLTIAYLPGCLIYYSDY